MPFGFPHRLGPPDSQDGQTKPLKSGVGPGPAGARDGCYADDAMAEAFHLGEEFRERVVRYRRDEPSRRGKPLRHDEADAAEIALVGDDQHGIHFTAPADRPRTMKRCTAENSTAAGSVVARAAAITSCQSTW